MKAGKEEDRVFGLQITAGSAAMGHDENVVKHTRIQSSDQHVVKRKKRSRSRYKSLMSIFACGICGHPGTGVDEPTMRSDAMLNENTHRTLSRDQGGVGTVSRRPSPLQMPNVAAVTRRLTPLQVTNAADVAAPPSCKSSLADQDYYSACSDIEELFGVGAIEDIDSIWIQMRVFDQQVPADIPPESLGASLHFATVIPVDTGLAGKWEKCRPKSSPVPGPIDFIIKPSFFVHKVRTSINRCNIYETDEYLKVDVIVPLPGFPPYVENFKKDGSLVTVKERRDNRSGRAFGQAMQLSDGRILTRVWNLGPAPEIMFEDIYTPGHKMFRIDHKAFRMDGTEEAEQLSIMELRTS